MAIKRDCLTCRNYTAFYTKAYTCFVKEKFGHCSLCHSIVENHHGCEKWISKGQVNRRRKAVALRALDEAIADIRIIKQILNEEKDEL